MARWPVCVELPPGLSADLASWHDDPEILHDAVERLHAARSALARELGAGVRARRGDAAERVAWSSLLERAPGSRTAERVGARASLARVEATPAASSGDARRRSDSGTRTPRDSSGGTYRRLASSQLRGMYSLSTSAEFRAAEAVRRETLRGCSDAAPSDVADADPSGVVRAASSPPGSPRADPLGSAAGLRRRTKRDCGVSNPHRRHTSRDVYMPFTGSTRRFRFRDARAHALRVAEGHGDENDAFEDATDGKSCCVFLSVAKRSDASTSACHVLRFRVSSRLGGGKEVEGATHDHEGDEGFGESEVSLVTRYLPRDFPFASRRTNEPRAGSEANVAFGDAPRTPWVAVVEERRTVTGKPEPEKNEKSETETSGTGGTGVHVYALDSRSSESPGVFLATPFAPTRLAASRGGAWLVACGARGVSAAWRGGDIREALRLARTSRTSEVVSERLCAPPVLFPLAAPRYGGVAPRGDAPDVLAFADDGRTLFAAHDGALFATWTLESDDESPRKPSRISEKTENTENPETEKEKQKHVLDPSSLRWRLRGVSYSTRETLRDGGAHVFGEARDEDDDAFARGSGFAFGPHLDSSRKDRDRPSLLVALARAKPDHDESRRMTNREGSRTRLVVGALDHTAGRGEAHRGAVFGAAEESFASPGRRRDSPPSGPGFEPVALAGARGGYAAVVGADGAVHVWDVVTGETLDAWYVDADGGARDGNRDAEREKRGKTTAKNLRVAVASANGAVLMVAVAFESGDDVVVETRRVCLPAEDARADAKDAKDAKRRLVSGEGGHS